MKLDFSTAWLLSLLLLTVRLAPVLAFAPPFAQLRLPRGLRAAVVFGLALALEPAARPAAAALPLAVGPLAVAVAGELVVGGVLAFALQTAFGSLHVAGRLLDTQAGQSMATVVDPGSAVPSPVISTLFTLVAGSVFFASNGHHDLLRVAAATLRAVPLGSLASVPTPGALVAQVSAMALMALTVAGVAMLALFITDLALAVMTRSMPQMNILVLGMQVKSIVLLLALAAAAGGLAPLVMRAVEQAFGFIGRVLGG